LDDHVTAINTARKSSSGWASFWKPERYRFDPLALESENPVRCLLCNINGVSPIDVRAALMLFKRYGSHS
jgi:hypothetical protein